jgi:NAD-dependent SIR2 family protein deacetylase
MAASLATTSAGDDRLTAFVRGHPRLLVLTGAGCSVASGIPEYRDHEGAW